MLRKFYMPGVGGGANAGTVASSGQVAAFVGTTWDPANVGYYVVLSEGNLREKCVGFAPSSTLSLKKIAVGEKKAFQTTLLNPADNTIGIGRLTMPTTDIVGNDSSGASLYTSASGYVLPAFSGLSTSFATNDVITTLIDRVGHTVSWQKNGVDIPGASMSIDATGDWYAAVGNGSTVGDTRTNFGSTAWAYALPAGYTGIAA